MDPTRQALESFLADHPNDLVAHAAYADWLIEHDDSRGEYIREALEIQGSGLQWKERNRRARALVEYAKQHEAEWLGPLYEFVEPDWRRVNTVRLANTSRSMISLSLRWCWIRSIIVVFPDPQLWAAFLNCPINRLVQRISRFSVPREADEGSAEWLMDLLQFPALRHLHVAMHEFADAGVDRLLATGILSRLTTLQMNRCNISDDGALALAAHPQIRKLKQLDLSWNYISPIGREALAVVGFNIGLQHADHPNFDDINLT